MTRYFLEYVDGLVANKLQADRSDWSDVVIPESLHEVDEATFLRTREGSTVNEDGTWSYDECTTYEVKSKGLTVQHTDRNTLRKVG